MKFRSLTLASLAACAALTCQPLWAQGDPLAGKQKNAMCAGCHGIEGFRTAYPEVYSVPKIGGQSEAYIINALKAYKAGERSHPSMVGIAGSLSEKDMADLAAYYAQQGQNK